MAQDLVVRHGVAEWAKLHVANQGASLIYQLGEFVVAEEVAVSEGVQEILDAVEHGRLECLGLAVFVIETFHHMADDLAELFTERGNGNLPGFVHQRLKLLFLALVDLRGEDAGLFRGGQGDKTPLETEFFVYVEGIVGFGKELAEHGLGLVTSLGVKVEERSDLGPELAFKQFQVSIDVVDGFLGDKVQAGKRKGQGVLGQKLPGLLNRGLDGTEQFGVDQELAALEPIPVPQVFHLGRVEGPGSDPAGRGQLDEAGLGENVVVGHVYFPPSLPAKRDVLFHLGLALLIEHGCEEPGRFLAEKVLNELGFLKADRAGKTFGLNADLAVRGDVHDDLFRHRQNASFDAGWRLRDGALAGMAEDLGKRA